MRNAWAVYIRELKSYFVSPIFYIVAAVFVFANGTNFKDTFFNFALQTMRFLRNYINYGQAPPMANVNDVAGSIFTFMNFISLLIIPLLTMRLYAEEKKNGTMELLMTSPITTPQILMGKFLSCLTIFSLLILTTVSFQVILYYYSEGKIDTMSVLTGYLGTFLLGGTLISIGMFFSSMTENQIVAAATTVTVVLGLWLVIFTSTFLNQPYNHIVRYMSLIDHLDSFARGYLGVRHIVYYLSMMVFWLFLTGISVESDRWRQ